jgi:hypothetical protein
MEDSMQTEGMSSSMRYFLVLFLSLGAQGKAASAFIEESDFDNLGYSVVPIIGYDDKSGWLYGAAGFAYSEVEPGINAGLFGVTNLSDFHSVTFNYEQRKGNWLYAFHGLTERAFDNYYGEGDLTVPENPFRISLYHFEAKPAILYRLLPHFRVGLYDDYRSRIETAVERSGAAVPGDPTSLFPTESSNAMGLRMEWDTRDKIINTRKGNYYQLLLSYSPDFWTNLPNHAGFYQAQLDLRRFRTLYRHLVFASRFLGALSMGDTTYLFRYRLGGLDMLRGYKDNRFRGDDYFLFQEELRWYIRKWLSINVSSDLGDVGDGRFNQLKITGQAGLRIGLPPGWGQKLRVDLGYGWDQQTFEIQFGEIF